MVATLEELERRVAVLEQEVEGEKVVSRYILDQTRRNGDDLAALRSRVDRLEAKVDALGLEFASLRRDLDQLRREFTDFQRGLPALIAETMREVLREERERERR